MDISTYLRRIRYASPIQPDLETLRGLHHQTSPHTSFTQRSIISRATEDGRVSLEDGRLIVTKNGRRTERPLQDETEFQALLKEYFEITL